MEIRARKLPVNQINKILYTLYNIILFLGPTFVIKTYTISIYFEKILLKHYDLCTIYYNYSVIINRKL